MYHIVRNQRHISNHPDTCNHCMDFHIRNAHNHFHRMSLILRMDSVEHCIVVVVVGKVPLAMVHQIAEC